MQSSQSIVDFNLPELVVVFKITARNVEFQTSHLIKKWQIDHLFIDSSKLFECGIVHTPQQFICEFSVNADAEIVYFPSSFLWKTLNCGTLCTGNEENLESYTWGIFTQSVDEEIGVNDEKYSGSLIYYLASMFQKYSFIPGMLLIRKLVKFRVFKTAKVFMRETLSDLENELLADNEKGKCGVYDQGTYENLIPGLWNESVNEMFSQGHISEKFARIMNYSCNIRKRARKE